MKIKRFLSAVLTLCLMLTILPASVMAEEEVTSGTVSARNGDFEWEFIDGTLYLTGSGYSIDDAPWEHLSDRIESIVFDGSLSLLGRVFSDFPRLKNITWPDEVRNVMGAFENCPSLEQVTIPDTVKSIEDGSFNGCNVLSYVKLPGNLDAIYTSFQGTTCLTEITLPNKLKTLSTSFNNSGLTGIVIPASVTYLGGLALGGCAYLEKIVFLGNPPDIDSKVFQNVKATVYYSSRNSKWNADVRKNYGGTLTWEGVSAPSKVDVKTERNWQIKNGVLTISGEMRNAPWGGAAAQIRKVVIEDGVTGICQNAFYYCFNLTEISIPASVKKIGKMAFDACEALTEINLPDSITSMGESVFAGCLSLKSIALSSRLTELPNHAFYRCGSLEEITFPAGLKTIGESVFDDCDALTEITIPGKVTKIGNYAFGDCSNLRSVKFDGNAPFFGESSFNNVEATVYYPAGNDTWTADVMQDYRGDITWKPYCVGDHVCESGTVTREPTCTETGILTCICEICGEETTEELPVIPHSYVDGICTGCGNSVRRISGSGRCETALAAADELKEILGVSSFDTIIIASGNNFADALTGSYLAAREGAPILLLTKGYEDELAAYVDENLTDGGKVCILGGASSVPETMADALADYAVRRLAGADRFETNLKILETAGVGDEEILVCTAYNFADSLSASAVGKPIMLVGSSLNDAQREYLSGKSAFSIIGGVNSVSEAIKTELGQYGAVERISGASREETSVAVAEKYFVTPEYLVLAYSRNFPDGLCGGPVAYALGAPLILTNSGAEAAAADYAAAKGITKGVILGGPNSVSDATVGMIIALKD